jgi:hypothetical protein
MLRASLFAPSDYRYAVEPFASGRHQTRPTTLGVLFVHKQRRYRFEVSLKAGKFVSEELVDETTNEAKVLVKRQVRSATGQWGDDPRLKPFIDRGFRDNALVTVFADSLAPDLASGVVRSLRDVIGRIWGNTPAAEEIESAAKRLETSGPFRDWLNEILRVSDLGVSGVSVDPAPNDEAASASSSSGMVSFRIRTRPRLRLLHTIEGAAEPISFDRESLGTRRLIMLAPTLFDLADSTNPAIVMVDELDSSLHPVLLEHIVRTHNVAPAGSCGQLIFTTHETSLLDGTAAEAALRRDQVFFTEKQPDGSAKLFALSQFQERNVTNIRKRYLEGRYGALPNPG